MIAPLYCKNGRELPHETCDPGCTGVPHDHSREVEMADVLGHAMALHGDNTGSGEIADESREQSTRVVASRLHFWKESRCDVDSAVKFLLYAVLLETLDTGPVAIDTGVLARAGRDYAGAVKAYLASASPLFNAYKKERA